MSTTTLDAPAGRKPSPGVTVKKVSFGRLLRSEWIKLWSLRSTWWTLGSTVVVLVGTALMIAAAAVFVAGQDADGGGGEAGQLFPASMVVTVGYQFGALVVAVLGSMVITGEYSTGMIRSTFTVAPHRLGAYTAKATVLAAVTAVLVAVAVGLSWLTTYPLLKPHGITVDWSDADQLRPLYGVVLYVVLVALFAIGIGTLIRHTAGAIFTMVAVFLVIPLPFGIASQFPGAPAWVVEINKFLPSVAGSAITGSGGDSVAAGGPEILEPWVGMGVLAAYTAALLIAGGISLKTRDA
ncbi:ABC transporter permease subunit [Myceligenerans indicum]|uniref:ABC transporter permease subunit n=1 Tax=Myceligenerans indicum TaxID=2593663 RepID=A0ABS1LHK8_9MICO|nr:ABC transporter permease subunit [Myceligenerans indicum]MBL0885634.1 ABC transporter permease subunit [Myceligenerans indicum]